jgi:hypothetical protein
LLLLSADWQQLLRRQSHPSIATTGVGTMLDEQAAHVRMLPGTCDEEWGLPVIGPLLHCCAVLQQHPRQQQVAIVSGDEQRRPALFFRRLININFLPIVREQPLHRVVFRCPAR